MPKITATIVFECDGEVSPESLKANLEDAIARQMDNFGLSGDSDEGHVTGFDIEMGEPQEVGDDELYALADNSTDFLDDLVHEFASEYGSKVNNGGSSEQVDFLVREMGRAELYEALKSNQE